VSFWLISARREKRKGKKNFNLAITFKLFQRIKRLGWKKERRLERFREKEENLISRERKSREKMREKMGFGIYIYIFLSYLFV